MMLCMRRLAIVLVCLLAAGACSSSSDETSSSDGASEAAASAGATSTTVAAPVELPPSAGCDATAPVAPGQTEERLLSGGVERTYIREVPAAEEPVPLVLDFHGYSEGSAVHVQMSELPAFGAEQGFVTLVPQGLGEPSRWDVALDSPDLDFVGDLLDEAERTLCIDRSRVYATGLSNGAFMTSSVACRYADRVAAIAPVAGIRDPEGCDPVRPVPILAIHGTDDQFVTYEGGLGERALDLPAPDGSGRTLREVGVEGRPPGEPSVPEIVASWAALYDCGDAGPPTPITEDVDAIVHRCPAGAAVELLRVEGGGHSWPGSALSAAIESIVGPTTTTISANEQLWAFFQDHPLPVG